MYIYTVLVVICWAIFILVWVTSWFGAKPSSHGGFGFGLRGILIRVGVVVIAIVAAHFGLISRTTPTLASTNAVGLQILGVVMCAAGVAFAIWARVYLGRNWGMPMSLRAEPELVTSGPYRYVRHPIYTGVLLAMFGSALVVGSWWLLVSLAGVVYFVSSAYREERDMLSLFPQTYPAYKARTKMIIPFVF